MAEEAIRSVDFRDWSGLVTDVDPHDYTAGTAREQINMTCVDLGEIQTRGGYKPVTFVSSGTLSAP